MPEFKCFLFSRPGHDVKPSFSYAPIFFPETEVFYIMAEQTPETNPTPQQPNNSPQQNQPQQSAEQQPVEKNIDLTALQSQLAASQQLSDQYRQAAIASQIAQQATLEAITLGVDVKTVPYVLKMADFSSVKPDKDGVPDTAAIQAAINKVLEDIPVLKPSRSEQSKGFQQIGAGGSQSAAQGDELARIFGNKK